MRHTEIPKALYELNVTLQNAIATIDDNHKRIKALEEELNYNKTQ